MAVNLSPVGGVAAQFFTSTGAVLTGGKLFTYLAGTTTPAATYTSSNGATAWTNPIVLDAAGRVPGSGEIWLTDGINYKFVLKDANDVLIATYDNINGINSNFVAYTNAQEIQTATAGQTVFTLTTMQYQAGTNSLSVFVDGVNQYGPGAQYSYVETDSTTVTFNSGLHVGAEVKFTTSQQQGAGAVDAQQVSYEPPFTGSVPTNVEAKLAQTVSVMDFGAVGDGIADDTQAFVDAFAASLNVEWPEGTFKVDSISIPTNANVKTAGFSTVIQQASGNIGTRVINIVGSNVQLGSISVKGNIATDTGEQNHAVFIQANTANGDLQNISLGDISGTNIRGDVLYMGTANSKSLYSVTAGKIIGDNVFRNIVAITGGSDVTIDSITGSPVGLFALDLEPESTGSPVTGIRIGYVKGNVVGVQSGSATNFCDAIFIDTLDVNPSYSIDSTPPYGATISSGLMLRNTKNIQIGCFKAASFNSFAIATVYNVGELGCEFLSIGNANISNCSVTDATYNAYIQAQPIGKLYIASGVFDVNAGKSLISYGANVVLTNFTAALGANAKVASYSTNLDATNATVTGTGWFASDVTKGSLTNATVTGAYLLTYCSPFALTNVTATASTSVFNASYENHYVKNCTLNTVYYADGFYLRDYGTAFRFGANWLWVDGSGKLRIKSTTAPTSDTDGTVVGTQT